MTDLPAHTIEHAAPSGAPASSAMGRLLRRGSARVCLAVVLAYFLLAGFVSFGQAAGLKVGPLRWRQQVGPPCTPPGRHALLGTDVFGQSVLRKTLCAARTSVTVALFASLLSIAVGVPLGALAGYFGGLADDLVVWAYSTFSAVPRILLILAFAVLLRDRRFCGYDLSGLAAASLAIGLTSWTGICRLIRGEVVRHRQRPYVLAAVSYGCSAGRIISRHLLPNVLHVLIVDFPLRFVAFVHAEVTLSFLGLGQPDQPSWGTMISDARLELWRGIWWQMAAAVAAIFILSLAMNFLADALRDAFDPRGRFEHAAAHRTAGRLL